jgi:hypothetical protein
MLRYDIHAGAFWSTYKHRTTTKILGGISPAGAHVYVSEAFPGRISDQAIVRFSGFLDKLETGDAVAADRGFDIEAMLKDIGCLVVHPPNARKSAKGDSAAEKEAKKRFTTSAARDTSAQANLRIHIERGFGECARACQFFWPYQYV